MAQQPFVRSYTSDPGAGRRFVVGMQTPANKGVLGFGLTPEEVAARRRQRLAQEMGLNITGAEHMPEQALVSMGLQAQRQRQEYAQRQALLAQEQEAEERERRAKMDALKGLARQRLGNRYTPVEIDQMADAGMLQQMVMGGIQDQEREQLRTVQEAAKRADVQKRTQAYIAANPDFAGEIQELIAQNPDMAYYPEAVKKRLADLQAARKVEQKQAEDAAKLEQDTKYYEALFVPESEGHALYRSALARGAKPEAAFEDARTKALAASRERREEEREKKREEEERAKIEFEEARRNLDKLEGEYNKMSGDARLRKQAAEMLPQVERARKEYASAFEKRMGRKQQPVVEQPEAVSKKGAAAGAQPPAAQPAPTPTQQPEGEAPVHDPVRRERSKVDEMSLPDRVRENVLQIGEALAKENRPAGIQYARRVREILSRVPRGQSAPQEIIDELRALMREFASAFPVHKE